MKTIYFQIILLLVGCCMAALAAAQAQYAGCFGQLRDATTATAAADIDAALDKFDKLGCREFLVGPTEIRAREAIKDFKVWVTLLHEQSKNRKAALAQVAALQRGNQTGRPNTGGNGGGWQGQLPQLYTFDQAGNLHSAPMTGGDIVFDYRGMREFKSTRDFKK